MNALAGQRALGVATVQPFHDGFAFITVARLLVEHGMAHDTHADRTNEIIGWTDGAGRAVEVGEAGVHGRHA